MGERANKIGTNYLFEVSERQFGSHGPQLQVPGFKPGKDSSEYPKRVFKFFRRLWDMNGYSPIQTPHHDVLVLPPVPDRPPMFLVNSYQGLSNGDVTDRRAYLVHYRKQRAILDVLSDEAARKAQEAKLGRILKHIPDVAGNQGVEQYSLVIPRSDSSRQQYRLTGSNAIHATKTYSLEAEAFEYNLPSRPTPQNASPYPDVSALAGYTLQFDGEMFDATPQSGAREPYADHWKQLLGQILPLLDNRPIGI